ncbi:hypothetical protein [uncultured Friedmanniella sp.]|uniref:hypothetical protein n=1 Tax=uncultured Friedmanniella sp. TaxID=335381 RepID=UPI0035CC2466
MSGSCSTPGCPAPAAWTVQVDRVSRSGIDVPKCTPHAFADVAKAEEVWGDQLYRVEVLRIVTELCPPVSVS